MLLDGLSDLCQPLRRHFAYFEQPAVFRAVLDKVVFTPVGYAQAADHKLDRHLFFSTLDGKMEHGLQIYLL